MLKFLRRYEMIACSNSIPKFRLQFASITEVFQGRFYYNDVNYNKIN